MLVYTVNGWVNTLWLLFFLQLMKLKKKNDKELELYLSDYAIMSQWSLAASEILITDT